MAKIAGGRKLPPYNPLADMKDTRQQMRVLWDDAVNNPRQAVQKIMECMKYAPDKGGDLMREMTLMFCQMEWSKTKGVYVFDETLEAAILATPLGDIKDSVFQSLPEDGIYISVEKEIDGGYLHGGFLSWMRCGGDDSIGITAVSPSGNRAEPYLYTTTSFFVYPHLPMLFSERDKKAAEQWESYPQLRGAMSPAGMPSRWHSYLAVLAAYLCSAEPDIRNPREPRNKPNRHVRNNGPVRQWEVGYRFGAAFRKQLAQAEAKAAAGYSGDERNRPRVHVRRAHWHSFWTGPLKGERKLITKWLPPVIVNAEGGELPVTVWKQS